MVNFVRVTRGFWWIAILLVIVGQNFVGMDGVVAAGMVNYDGGYKVQTG